MEAADASVILPVHHTLDHSQSRQLLLAHRICPLPGAPVLAAADVLVELHTLKPGPGLGVPAIIKGIEACMADKATFTPDDLAAALQQLRHRCQLLMTWSAPASQACLAGPVWEHGYKQLRLDCFQTSPSCEAVLPCSAAAAAAGPCKPRRSPAGGLVKDTCFSRMPKRVPAQDATPHAAGAAGHASPGNGQLAIPRQICP